VSEDASAMAEGVLRVCLKYPVNKRQPVISIIGTYHCSTACSAKPAEGFTQAVALHTNRRGKPSEVSGSNVALLGCDIFWIINQFKQQPSSVHYCREGRTIPPVLSTIP
jgi:hypothetical protein